MVWSVGDGSVQMTGRHLVLWSTTKNEVCTTTGLCLSYLAELSGEASLCQPRPGVKAQHPTWLSYGVCTVTFKLTEESVAQSDRTG